MPTRHRRVGTQRRAHGLKGLSTRKGEAQARPLILSNALKCAPEIKSNRCISMPTVVIDPADILTPAELSKRLKVSRSWPYEKMRPRHDNPLPGFRIGHHIRFSWPEVCAWLATTSNIKAKPAPGAR